MSVDGLTPPHDLDSEAAVISYVLLHGTAEVALGVADLVQPGEMYSEAHRRVLEACYGVAKAGSVVDVVTVGAWLKDRDRMNQVGGYAYLTEIIDAAPAVSGKAIASYAKTVRQHAQRRKLLETMQRSVAQIYVGVEDHDEFMHGVARQVSDLAIESAKAKKGLEHVKAPILRFAESIKAMAQGASAGIPTGLLSVDRLTGGLHDGDLTFIGARPGMGKTSLVMNAVENITGAVDNEGRVQTALFFSLEMPSEQLAARLIASRSRVSVSALRNGKISREQMPGVWKSAGELAKLPIYVDDTPRLSVDEIAARSKAKAREIRGIGQRLALVVIDYLQIMNLKERGTENESTSIGRVTGALKSLAKELSCPVVCLAQLNRELEKRQDKRPTIPDLRGSGAIEQDADNIIFIYRDGYYAKQESGVAEIIIAKQRNGKTGAAEAYWDGPTCRFTSSEASRQSEEYEHAF